jgi:hypothetical protein
LLQVEFEQTGSRELTMEAFDFAGVKLPEGLRARVREAVERFSMARLEQCFAEMHRRGGDTARLAAHLRALAEGGDLESVGAWLGKAGPS